MTPGFDMKVFGLKEVVRRLEKFPPKIQRKIVRRAVRLSTKPVKLAMRQEIRARLKKHTGNLYKSISHTTKTYRGSTIAVAGPKWGSGAYHAHLLERGTKDRYTNTNKRTTLRKRLNPRVARSLGRTVSGFRGRVIGKHYGRIAYDKTSSAVREKMLVMVLDGILREADKAS